MGLSSWLKAARLQLHTIGLAPLLLGSAIAWYETSHFDWALLLLAVLTGFSIHLVTAFVNDAADVAADAHNRLRTPFSGGSGVIVDGLLSRSRMLTAAGLAALSSFLTASAMVFLLDAHWGVFLFVAAGLISGAGYSLPPLKVSYRGGGELLVLVTYSVGLVWAGYYVQAGPSQTPLLWLLSAPVGLAVFSLITVTQFPDRDADRKAGKRSLVIILGERKTLLLIASAVALSGIAGAAALPVEAAPAWTGVLSVLGLPPALLLAGAALKREPGPALFDRLSRGTLLLTLWFSLGPSAGLVLDRLLGRAGAV